MFDIRPWPMQTKKKEACAGNEKPALKYKAVRADITRAKFSIVQAEFILIDITELTLN